MKFDIKYGTHLPILMRTISMTDGDVLECGTGIFSTFYLHYICTESKRNLVSYETDGRYYDMFKQCENEYHKLILVNNEDWDSIDIEKPWDVVLIDHAPGSRRRMEAKRLANYAKYILLHDSHWKQDRNYHYKEIYPLFKYRYDYTLFDPPTAVVSNLVDLSVLC